MYQYLLIFICIYIYIYIYAYNLFIEFDNFIDIFTNHDIPITNLIYNLINYRKCMCIISF